MSLLVSSVQIVLFPYSKRINGQLSDIGTRWRARYNARMWHPPSGSSDSCRQHGRRSWVATLSRRQQIAADSDGRDQKLLFTTPWRSDSHRHYRFNIRYWRQWATQCDRLVFFSIRINYSNLCIISFTFQSEDLLFIVLFPYHYSMKKIIFFVIWWYSWEAHGELYLQ